MPGFPIQRCPGAKKGLLRDPTTKRLIRRAAGSPCGCGPAGCVCGFCGDDPTPQNGPFVAIDGITVNCGYYSCFPVGGDSVLIRAFNYPDPVSLTSTLSCFPEPAGGHCTWSGTGTFLFGENIDVTYLTGTTTCDYGSAEWTEDTSDSAGNSANAEPGQVWLGRFADRWTLAVVGVIFKRTGVSAFEKIPAYYFFGTAPATGCTGTIEFANELAGGGGGTAGSGTGCCGTVGEAVDTIYEGVPDFPRPALGIAVGCAGTATVVLNP